MNPTARDLSKPRFDALDGWRGLAALLVAFYHAPLVMPMRGAANWQNIELAVDLFFVLSGFVMMHAWGSRLMGGQGLTDFVSRRFFRIYPLHVVMLAALVLLEAAKWVVTRYVAFPLESAPFTEARSPALMVSNLFLTQAMGLHGSTSWNDPGWSISVEFWAYIVFALVAVTFRRRMVPVLLVVGALAAIALMQVGPRRLLATYDYGFLRALYDFSIGVATYSLVMARHGQPRFGGFAEAGVLALAGAFLWKTGQNASIWFAPFVFAAVIYVFAQGEGVFTRLLRSRPIHALGEWSYSIYLVHSVLFYGLTVLLQALTKMVKLPLIWTHVGGLKVFSSGSAWGDALILLAMLGLTVAVASHTYRLIELPWMKRRPIAAAVAS